MGNSKSLQWAILVSILAHSVFFLGLPRMGFMPSKRHLEKIKIAYYKIKEASVRKKISKNCRRLGRETKYFNVISSQMLTEMMTVEQGL